MEIRCVFYVLAFFVVIFYGLSRFESTSQSLMQVIQRLNEKITTVEEIKLLKQTSLKLKQFDWVTCSGPDASARINQIYISDPLTIPGNIIFTVDSVLNADVQSPIKVVGWVEKKILFFWVTILKFDIEDICDLIPFPPGEPCPEPFLSSKLPCNCPVSKGDYIFKNMVVQIPSVPVPQFFVPGPYSVQVKSSMNNQEVICFESNFELV